MRVSQKADYALRAMLELALRAEAVPVRSAEIAQAQKIPEKFLELILVELRRAGLIGSQRGPVGGHRLAREPEQISIGEIWRAIDGPLPERNGKDDPFRLVWMEVDRAITKVVEHVTLADVKHRLLAGQTVPDFNI